MLDAIAEWAEALLALGYPGLAGVVLLENLVPPIPSELVLPLAGYRVAEGELTYWLAVVAATAGSVAGAVAIHALGRHGGRPLLRRHRRLLRLRERDLDRAEAWFLRHGAWAVVLGRLVPGVRTVISFPAGMAGMPLRRFVALTAAGSLLWNAALIAAGWQLGRNHHRVGAIVDQASIVVLGSGATLLVAGIAVLAIRRLSSATPR
jgi:membrane protein DedA with SNARE-associated domain